MSVHRVVIVGASAAGLRCACRLARLQPGWDVTVVEARETFSYGACGLPYVLGGEVESLDALHRTTYGAARDAAFFADAKGVTVLGGWRAVAADGAARTLTIERAGERRELGWDELVLATGARPRTLADQPEHPRVRSFHVWEDVAPLHQGLARGQLEHVAVVGAGLVGCELAEAFRSLWGVDVTLIEAAATPLPQLLDPEPAALVAARLRGEGVRLLTGAAVAGLVPDDDGVTLVTGSGEVRADAVVVAIGVVPAVHLARQLGAELGATGAIAVSERLATSLPGVWAAGDCIEVRHAVTGRPCHLPLGSLANRQGRVLANVLAGRDDRFAPVAGSVALRVFDWNVAATGLTLGAARALGLAARAVWVSEDDRAHYWPEASELHLELVYEAGTRRLLGVQACGAGEVAKRVDVAAQHLLRGATLGELTAAEHAYAPPYAPALDPLQVAAAVAENQEDGLEAVSPLSLVDGASVLDVRQAEERERRPAPGGWATEVEYAALRCRLHELHGGPWLVVCERGTRSAEAARLLRAAGHAARYLGGGMHWRAACGEAV